MNFHRRLRQRSLQLPSEFQIYAKRWSMKCLTPECNNRFELHPVQPNVDGALMSSDLRLLLMGSLGTVSLSLAIESQITAAYTFGVQIAPLVQFDHQSNENQS